MKTCGHCQQNLLPLLYDLLEENEAQAVRDHLETCAACQAALDRAREQQSILAGAFRETFPQVAFDPSAPMVLTLRPAAAPRQRRGWQRWAVAAALVGCALGLAGYLGHSGWSARENALENASASYAAARRALKEKEASLLLEHKQIEGDIGGLHGEIDTLLATWSKAKEIKHFAAPDDTRVVIERPASLQAGGKNEISIDIARPGRVGATPAKGLRAEIVNPETKEVLFGRDLNDAGRTKLTLPPDLPLKAGSKLSLVVREEGGKGAGLSVVDHLALVTPDYMTHLYLDRPLYRPGETVRFRSLTLERFSLRPASETLNLRFVLKGPAGERVAELEKATVIVDEKTNAPVLGPDGEPVRGVALGEFTVPDGALPGRYAIEVADLHGRFAAEMRSFDVAPWIAPRLLKELNLDRSSYGPGDKVEVHGLVRRVADDKTGVFTGQVVVTIDGGVAHQARITTEADGTYRHVFALPAAIARGDAQAKIEFDVDGVTEPVSRTLPIVLDAVLIDFYPEGGELVADLPSRVYFQARTPLGAAADVEGAVVDADDRPVATARTLRDKAEPGINQGMGVFTFTPRAGQTYRFKVDAPKKLTSSTFALPMVKADGVALLLPATVTDQAIPVVLHSGADRELLVGAYCRGKLLDHATLKVKKAEKAEVTLQAPPGLSGVYRITVFEKTATQYIPRAERLTYNRGGERLDIALVRPAKAYKPGAAKLDLEIRDEKKAFSPSILLVSVVDLGLVKLADDRTARGMPAHFLLTSEVRRPQDLENTNVLLGAHPRAAEALDLLLGVQGWRRFAEQDPRRLQKLDYAAAGRLMPGLAPVRITLDPRLAELATLRERQAATYLDLQERLRGKKAEQAAKAGEHKALAALAQTANDEATRAEAAQDRLQAYQTFLWRGGALGALLAALFTALALVRWGMGAQARGASGRAGFLGGAALLASLLVVSVVGVILSIQDEAPPPEQIAFERVKALAAPPVTPGPDRAGRPALAEASEPKSPEAKVTGKKTAPSPAPPKTDMARGSLSTTASPHDTVGKAETSLPPARTADGMFGKPKSKELGFGPPHSLPPGPHGEPAGGKGGGFGGVAFPAVPAPTTLPVVSPPGVPVPILPPAVTDAAGARPPADFHGGGSGSPETAKAGTGGPPTRPIRPRGDLADSPALPPAGKFRSALEREFFREVVAADALPPCVLREYAHHNTVITPDSPVLLWAPVVIARDGKATISFDFPGRATSWEMTVFTHSVSGQLGSATFTLPVRVDP